jgi:hypothetical protein
MQCKQAQELFSDHLAGQLDPALNVTLENHVRACETCRAEIAGLRRIWSSLDALPTVEPPPFFHDNLMHRINMEQDKAAEAAQRSGWNWRAIFQPRSPVFAAALLIIALLGMGELHVQHASLDPIGAIWRLLSPPKAPAVPGLETARAEWHPNGQGGGTLTLYLQAQPGTTVSVDSVNYRVALKKHTVTESDLSVTADHETTASISLDSRPTSDLTLTVRNAGGSATLPVTLMEPIPAPTSDR